jgi:hypothetical protein
MYVLTAIGLTPGGSSTVNIYTQTVHRTTQLRNWEECGPWPFFVRYTLAFVLQLRKKHGKTSVKVVSYLPGTKISEETLTIIFKSVVNVISTELGNSKSHITIGCLLFEIFCDAKFCSTLPSGWTT